MKQGTARMGVKTHHKPITPCRLPPVRDKQPMTRKRSAQLEFSLIPTTAAITEKTSFQFEGRPRPRVETMDSASLVFLQVHAADPGVDAKNRQTGACHGCRSSREKSTSAHTSPVASGRENSRGGERQKRRRKRTTCLDTRFFSLFLSSRTSVKISTPKCEKKRQKKGGKATVHCTNETSP